MMKDISLHIMDIMQNSIRAGAHKIELAVRADRDSDLLCVTIKDNGCGMNEEFLKGVTDPFVTTRTTRSVGLGIPMFKQSGEITGGKFDIRSIEGEGTLIEAGYVISSIDRIPLGNIGDTVSGLILSYPDLRYIVELGGAGGQFLFDTDDIKKQLDGVPIQEFEVIDWIRKYINEGVRKSFSGTLKEIY